MELVEVVGPDVRVLSSEYEGVKSRIPHIRTIYVKRPEGGLSTTEIIKRCQDLNS